MAARIELNHKLHVLTRKEELDSVRLPGKVVVVLDILFATTTMVAALAHGASEIVPVASERDARAEGARCAAGSFVLSGELYAETLPGFAHPAPLALIAHGVQGKCVIYSTTNGTVAMTQAEGAAHVYCGSLLNAQALARHVAARHAESTVLVVCSGSGGNFNLEDFYGAGCMVDRFAALAGAALDLSDAARAALAYYRQSDALQVLLESRVGRMMAARGLQREVEFACRADAFPVVPAYAAGRLRLEATAAPAPR